MRRVLAAAVLLAFLPTANAQDKGKSDFSHNAEFRVRDTFEMNETGTKDIKPSHHNGIEQRFKLGLGFKANEKMAMTATLLQSSVWGEANNGHTFATSSVANSAEENFMSVNEAFATWMVSEDFNAKFGRMNFSFGDGSVMAVNEWEQNPFSFEGVNLNYEAEFGRFHGFMFKYEDLYDGTPAQSLTSDPQHDAYGLIFDLKTMPEWLKWANLFVIQDVKDATTGTAGMNALRYGVGAGANFAMVDVKADYVNVTGKDTTLITAAPSTKTDIESHMMQIEAGFNMAAFMGSRWYVGYHQDTGSKTGDTKNKTYDGYFNEQHGSTGMMDLFKWGNLTNIYLGWTMKPMDNNTFGIAYHMLSKTEKAGTIGAGKFGTLLNASATSATEGNLGSEVDLWAQHEYGNGFTMTARLGQFMPGNAFKDAAVARKDSVTQAMLEAKMTF